MLTNIPLATLHTFETAARHLNFTQAAHELNLTQGAVSQPIKKLEKQLGFPRFHRQIRQVTLTTNGKELLRVVRRALTDIDRTIERLRDRNRTG